MDGVKHTEHKTLGLYSAVDLHIKWSALKFRYVVPSLY